MKELTPAFQNHRDTYEYTRLISKMSSEGGSESPPPERQTGPQLGDPTADGQGVSEALSKEELKAQLDVRPAATMMSPRC